MTTPILPNIDFPELFFGFVCPIGVDMRPCLASFRKFLEDEDYHVHEIRVTDLFKLLKDYVSPKTELNSRTEQERYRSYINYGNQLREHFEDNAILSALAIGQVMRARTKTRRYDKVAYLLHQFKRKEEIDLLRSVYDRLFFQVSIYSRRGTRVDNLAKNFAASKNTAEPNKYRADAEGFVQTDEHEAEQPHGQRVAKIFHDADFIINADRGDQSVKDQVNRLCELIFSSNSISPTKQEYGMFMARAAALRTLDLSRQVGSAIFSIGGDVVCLGANEVPKGGGGTYWEDELWDDREFKRGYDSNDKRKAEILRDIASALDKTLDETSLATNDKIADSQLMDALEYGRIVHAEMSAICDAARLGRPLKGSTLYCTTFPCHMCAKHIVASGISQVVFLEPYPKSLAADLHTDSIEIEGSGRGQYSEFPSVKFEHFFGITPRLYREVFERGKRKDSSGRFQDYRSGKKMPFVRIKSPFYHSIEQDFISNVYANILSVLKGAAE